MVRWEKERRRGGELVLRSHRPAARALGMAGICPAPAAEVCSVCGGVPMAE